ncbi:hypothetical protein RvY_02523 [Ramazzottius varieornatus]|uniref:Uncharacterized protein n=1 Tax=Ramazzottius varieornatus TaxID=947166 RepID=A0A1D1US18_RAMVA|nr:hypothetical protein RvY_02523 [Ramazzottius varieornatus]
MGRRIPTRPQNQRQKQKQKVCTRMSHSCRNAWLSCTTIHAPFGNAHMHSNRLGGYVWA